MLLPVIFIFCVNILLCHANVETTCEGNTMSLKCSPEHVIKIHAADYGRHSFFTCINLFIGNRSCSAADSLSIVGRKCNNQEACSIEVSNTVFGDPCKGTAKYLTVNYTCELIHKEYEEMISCENHDMILGCPDGMILNIIGASYGRSCEDQCPAPGLRTDIMNCSAANSSKIVQDSCDDLNMCIINVSSGLFGDPCKGVAKYLEVNYTCAVETTQKTTHSTIMITPPNIITVRTCQNTTLDFGCPAKTVIDILYANFGRISPQYCTSSGNPNSTCININSTEIIRRRCDDRESCSVSASENVFGDHCQGYLEVEYSCVDFDPFIQACEGSSLTITCQAGTVINVTEAEYGRLSNSVCSTSNPGSLNCSAADAYQIVKNKCNDKDTCTVDANSETFGDPCVGIEKYLQIHFKCIINNTIPPTIPMRACQNTTLDIRCPAKTVIDILKANFGRTSSQYCTSSGNPNITCINNNSTEIVSQICDDKETCSVSASTIIFGNHCQGYLEVDYSCVDFDPSPHACEGSSLTITCEAGTVINVTDAEYGRLSNSVCTTSNPGSLNCSAADAYQIVKNKCDDKDTCTVDANNKTFGDPCVGIEKYLQINFYCTIHNTNSTNIHIVRACQDTMLAIGCPANTVIDILNANFGRTSSQYCTSSGNPNVTCINNNSTEIVRQSCDNKENCFVSASENVFGGLCQGYLEVEYSCVDFDPFTQACEGSSLTITCEAGTVINVTDAEYGRLSNSVCTTSNPGSLNCSAADAYQIVKNKCDDKDTCTVDANNKTFGDPCVGIEKYLQINFYCTINNTIPPRIPIVRACQDTMLAIGCPANTVIDILNANFGRTSSQYCTSSGNPNATCININSTEIVRQSCDNKESCFVSASENVFGNHCQGYLEVEYSCVDFDPLTQACEGSSLTITCEAGTVINVTDAEYGRLSNSVCATSNPGSLNCSAADAYQIVKKKCDDKDTCTVDANNKTFGDPCVGIEKYLQINFTCTPRDVLPKNHTVRTCQNTTLFIGCPANTVIDILKANFGRTSSQYCTSSGNPNVTCINNNSTEIVSQICDDKETCSVSASTIVFGNHCQGYLEVEYSCVDFDPLTQACEGSSLTITCEAGTVINVTDAEYGRLSNSVCTTSNPGSLNCSAADAYQIVKNKCDDKDTCTVDANNKTFGDPCVGIEKYLQINFYCTINNTNSPNIHIVRACQDTMLAIGCPANTVIDILNANFGRTSSQYCTSSGNPNATCININSTEIVRQSCDNKESCFVSASAIVFGNHCQGYLEVEYSCVDFDPFTQACEGSSLTITCEAGTVINVTDAEYGRLSNSVCATSNPGSLNCSAADANQIVKKKCDDKDTCTVDANNKTFGDPCVGIEKYLQINYTCLKQKGPVNGSEYDILNGTACEDTNLTISCPDTDYIYIYRAKYGSTSLNICGNNASEHNTSCTAPRTTSIVSANCNGLITCTINASDSVFSNNCSSNIKYLEVQYVCLIRVTAPIPQLNGTACEGTDLSLSCSADATINITEANYGRTNTKTCPRIGQDQNDNCTDSDSYNIVKNRCSGKSSCSIEANNTEFGKDPCPGTYKYLEVEYDCLYRVDPIPYKVTGCDGVTMKLSCPAELKIQVVAAIYGQTGEPLCSKPGMNNDVYNCISPNGLGVVSQRCNAKENCSILVSNSTFGDPCPGIAKYLIVYYTCVGNYLQCGINERIGCSNQCDTNKICSAATEVCSKTPCVQGCICNPGYERDSRSGICINSTYCPILGQPCQTHEHFSRCGAGCQLSCNSTVSCDNVCNPGYACNSGFVRHNKKCIRPEDCPCTDNATEETI